MIVICSFHFPVKNFSWEIMVSISGRPKYTNKMGNNLLGSTIISMKYLCAWNHAIMICEMDQPKNFFWRSLRLRYILIDPIIITSYGTNHLCSKPVFACICNIFMHIQYCVYMLDHSKLWNKKISCVQPTTCVTNVKKELGIIFIIDFGHTITVGLGKQR